MNSKTTHWVALISGIDGKSRKIPMMTFRGKNQGPLIWFCGGIHGDEGASVQYLLNLVQVLSKIRCEKGSVIVLPCVNVFGFEAGTREIPESLEDLNRSFPGRSFGSLTERMADHLFQLICRSKPNLVIDCHTDWCDSIPHVLLDPLSKKIQPSWNKAREFARLSQLPVLCETMENGIENQKTLTCALLSRAIPALTMEFPGHRKEIEIERNPLINILVGLQMISQKNAVNFDFFPSKLSHSLLTYSDQVRSLAPGFIQFCVKPGDVVERGARIASIINLLGKPIETLNAPSRALVVGLTDSEAIMPGEALISFGLME